MGSGTYSHVFWDWNGTLFDDVEWCIDCINVLLARRGRGLVDGVAAYRRAFRFPVMEYYRAVGFDFSVEAFEVVAAEFISLYLSRGNGGCGLHSGARAVLAALQGAGVRQVVLSASERTILLAQMEGLGVLPFFDEVLGLSDVYARSKVGVGLAYLARADVGRAVLIGDTTHDVEVAAALGVDCVLVANGHQGRAVLEGCGVPVLGDVSEVVGWVF